MMAGCEEHGAGHKVLALFHALTQNPSLLMQMPGALADIKTAGSLIGAYGKLGDVASARRVFDDRKGEKDRRTLCAALMTALERNGCLEEIIALYQEMKESGGAMGSVYHLIVLNACCKSGHFSQAKAVHADLLASDTSGWMRRDVLLQTQLIGIYGKAGELAMAKQLFDDIAEEAKRSDVVVWTSLIWSFGVHGKAELALELFASMQSEYVLRPRHGGRIWDGVRVFEQCQASGECNEKVVAAMIDGYARNGRLREGYALFIEYKRASIEITCSWRCCTAVGITMSSSWRRLCMPRCNTLCLRRKRMS